MRIETNIPAPTTISEIVRALKPNQSVLLEADAPSVRTIVSRIKANHKSRKYATRKVNGGIRVWRTQ